MTSLPLRFALREMRGGLSGFFIFIACIALGVAAIGGVNSVARSISSGVASQGQTLLGGDLRFELNQREATPAEQTFPRRPGKNLSRLRHAFNGAFAGRFRPGAGRGQSRRRRLSALR